MSHIVREPLQHGRGTRIMFRKTWRDRIGADDATLGMDSTSVEGRRVNAALLVVMINVWDGFFGVTLTDEFLARVGTPRTAT